MQYEFRDDFIDHADEILRRYNFIRPPKKIRSLSDLSYILPMRNYAEYYSISFRYISSSRELSTSLRYHNSGVSDVFERCDNPLKGLQRWVFAINHLSFPKWSNIWHLRIQEIESAGSFASRILGNFSNAFPEFYKLCDNLELVLSHLVDDSEIGEQLSLMIEHRIKTAVAVAIFLDMQLKIPNIFETYNNKYFHFDFNAWVRTSALDFLQCQVRKGAVDQGIEDRVMELLS